MQLPDSATLGCHTLPSRFETCAGDNRHDVVCADAAQARRSSA